MSGAAGPDPYLDPAGGVLRNRLGITDAGELARAEAALSASRIVDLERRRLPGRYDLAHLRAFHRLILGDVYDWAGELRTVSIAKGSVFCLPSIWSPTALTSSAGSPPLTGCGAWPARSSLPGWRSFSLTSTPCTRSGRATAGPSGRSSPSSRTTPGITSTGSAWSQPVTSRPALPRTAVISPRCARCSASSLTGPTRQDQPGRPAGLPPDAHPHHDRASRAGTEPEQAITGTRPDTAGDGPATRECSLVAAMRHVRVAGSTGRFRFGLGEREITPCHGHGWRRGSL